ncbi:hypothetical protein AWB95_22175 [Mycobacterium celatum]|nr:hypothetical protein AWB95_22175 [Mycobacterium celatum]
MLPGCSGAKENPQNQPTPSKAAKLGVSSPAFADNTQIPVEYSCKGRNVPPPLRWDNVPTGAQSLALVVDDPDAPSGLYIHWVVTGIPTATTELGPLPPGASVSLNSAGKPEYFGPCPPAGSGVHHYRFQLYALNKPLALAPTTPAPEATKAIADAASAQGTTVGLFSG